MYTENCVPFERASNWFDILLQETPWRQETIRLFGKQHQVPRLSSWVADQGLAYSYSNMTMQAANWTNTLNEIRGYVQKVCGEEFNSVLLNYYRDGQDSNGWHSDDEAELGENPCIASLSLGATRYFDLRCKRDHKVKYRLALQHGSLLVMKGSTQTHWQHQIPKRAAAHKRLNLTFRTILACA